MSRKDPFILAVQILRRLEHAKRRDAKKGGDGSRTTREIQEGLEPETTMAVTRRILNRMHAAGMIIGYTDHTWGAA